MCILIKFSIIYFINKVFYKTLFLDEYCQLPNLSSGNYLIEIEQIHDDVVLTKDYIFYKVQKIFVELYKLKYYNNIKE